MPLLPVDASVPPARVLAISPHGRHSVNLTLAFSELEFPSLNVLSVQEVMKAPIAIMSKYIYVDSFFIVLFL